ncbi:MAG: cytochrome c [Chloroflexi bacterium]|nr:cytochrome c [Chloroflexota bacterium]
MDRFLVPRLGFALVIGLASVLIGVIVLRSPDTHGNLWEAPRPGYVRTDIAMLAGEDPREAPQTRSAFTLAGVSWRGGPPLDPGRAIYLREGCATCHGLDARGAEVGPSLAGSPPEIVTRMVRDGPKGMPAYAEAQLSAADLAKLADYLQGLKIASKSSEEVAAIQRLIYDPSVSRDELLKGKAALRRSCGACHTQPTNEEILHAFRNDAEAARLVVEMVQDTNLSIEDAKAIAHYMLAIRNGADPVKGYEPGH